MDKVIPFSFSKTVHILKHLQGILYEYASNSEFCYLEKSSQHSFKAGGLHLTVLEPLRRWRVLFNGILKY